MSSMVSLCSSSRLLSLHFSFNVYHSIWFTHLQLLVTKMSFLQRIWLQDFNGVVLNLAFNFTHILISNKNRLAHRDLTYFVKLIQNKDQFVSSFTSYCGKCNSFDNLKRIASRCLRFKPVAGKSEKDTKQVRYKSDFRWNIYETYRSGSKHEGLTHVRNCLAKY